MEHINSFGCWIFLLHLTKLSVSFLKFCGECVVLYRVVYRVGAHRIGKVVGVDSVEG